MSETRRPVLGILALQGDVEKHQRMIETHLSAAAALVRTPEHLTQVDALILPGGESTTMIRLLERVELDQAIRERAATGMPIYGTCAGMILMAKQITGKPDQHRLGLMDIEVTRNAFGPQIESFEADIELALQETGPSERVRGVFIRAPYVAQAGPGARVLGRYQDKIVGVRQGFLLATAFHPELTDDPRVHRYFLRMVEESRVESTEGIRPT